MLKVTEIENSEKIWVTMADGQAFEMAVEDAAREDEPEGTLNVHVSATLFHKLLTAFCKSAR